MAKYVIEDITLNNTANAIREKTGKTDKITPSNFATEIASIKSSSSITKPLVFNEYDDDGYPTDASIKGIEELPEYFLYSYTGRASGNFKGYGYYQSLAKLELPDSITAIPDYFAHGCVKLSLIEIPSGVTKIGNYAFYSCALTPLEEITGEITEVGNYAFSYTSIKKLTFLSANLTKFGAYVFYQTGSLKVIKLPNVSSVPQLGLKVFDGTSCRSEDGGIYVPDALVDSFKSATNWAAMADYIKPISELEASV